MATKLPDKRAVHDALLTALRASLEKLARGAEETRKGAVHEEGRSEGDKDMRATEQSYVARGQAMRVEDLAEQVQRLEATKPEPFGAKDKIAAGALVRVSLDDDEERLFYVSAFGGGTGVAVGKSKVIVVTPRSPVGAALCGKARGDSFELAVSGKLREWSIEEVG